MCYAGDMKYAFVTFAIVAIWVATIMIIGFMEIGGVFLPLVALGMSVILFLIGFLRKK